MKKARKKPVVIEFIEFKELWQMLLDYYDHNYPIPEEIKKIEFATKMEGAFLKIPTLEGVMKMTDEDVLIIGIKGEVYPCKIDVFEASYEVL